MHSKMAMSSSALPLWVVVDCWFLCYFRIAHFSQNLFLIYKDIYENQSWNRRS